MPHGKVSGTRQLDRLTMETLNSELAKLVQGRLPPNIGFCLMLFTTGNLEPELNYRTNISDESLAMILEHVAFNLRAGQFRRPLIT